jgi:TRAP-type transport system periplasmic protein
VTKFATVADLYTMPMMIVMNKGVWESLPDDIKALIEGTTGLKMSSAAGKAFDDAEKPFREMTLNKGVQEIIMEPVELDKMKNSTVHLREEWAEEMEAKGLPGKSILKTVLELIEK